MPIFRPICLGLVCLIISGCARAQTTTQTPPLVSTTPSTTPAFIASTSNLPLRLPGPAVRTKRMDARIEALKAKNRRLPTFDAYRRMVEIYLQLGLYEEAVQTHRTQAVMYRQKGLVEAAIIEESRAARYETSVGLYVDRGFSPQEIKALDTKQRLEPPVGCYAGAFIDRDEQLKTIFLDENWHHHRRPEDFVRLVGKPHASYFAYLRYGDKFPRKWAQHLKAANAIPHLAWEPRNIGAVRDDAYLQNFAKECAALDWPIFIRFASEMNGFWTPYHGNPQLYREKFRLVHNVLHRYASKVATIWCVSNPPLRNVADYYPGDHGCDWVGVNLYSVPFYDNDPRRPAFLDNPLELLDPIYRMYAHKKPIAICEYAASHMAAWDRVRRNDFAIDKLSLLYSSLPLLYPRVKLIDWFDMDNLRNAKPGRQLNNYNLTEQPSILQAYRRVVATPWFLGRATPDSDPAAGDAPPGDDAPRLPRPLQARQAVSGVTRFTIWAKTYVPRPKVYLKLGNKIVYAGQQPGAHRLDLDMNRHSPGQQPVTVYVYDDRNRFVTLFSSVVTVRKEPS